MSTPGGITTTRLTRLAHLLAPAAFFARRGDDFAAAIAGGAGGDIDKLAQDALLHAANFAGAVARFAADGRCAGLAAIAGAARARLIAHDFDFLLAAKNGLKKIDLQVIAQIGATARAAALLCAGAREAAKELVEDIVDIAKALAAAAAKTAVAPRMTISDHRPRASARR